jgi:hypothetical protein
MAEATTTIGGVKESKDYHLNRLACYLVAQN